MAEFHKIPVDLFNNIFDYIGTGDPTTPLSNASVGSLYRKLDGVTGGTLWQKTSSGWEALASGITQAVADGRYGQLAAANNWSAVNQFSNTLAISATTKFYLDGGFDTYIYESAGNQVDFVVGSLQSIRFVSNAIALPATNRLYLDGGGDTYIYEAAADQVDLYVGSELVLRARGGASDYVYVLTRDLIIDSTFKLRLDGSGSGDTYIHELAANVTAFVVGGTEFLRITSSTGLIQISSADLAVSATKKLFLDGGGDTYIAEASANRMEFVAGGALYFRVNGASAFVEVLAADLMIPSAKKLYLDGGSDTYIWEAASNRIDFVAGGSTLFQVHSTGLTFSAALFMSVAATTFALGNKAYLNVQSSSGGGNALLWGHSNTDYINTLGVNNSSGEPYVCFHAYQTTGDGFLRRGSSTFPMQIRYQSLTGTLDFRYGTTGTVDTSISWTTQFSFSRLGVFGAASITTGLVTCTGVTNSGALTSTTGTFSAGISATTGAFSGAVSVAASGLNNGTHYYHPVIYSTSAPSGTAEDGTLWFQY